MIPLPSPEQINLAASVITLLAAAAPFLLKNLENLRVEVLSNKNLENIVRLTRE